MRVISMVPSWTETLLEAGVDVVGRTRFCVHPAGRIAQVPVVGGTKDISWEKVAELRADLLLLDREENPKSFAEEATLPWFATHVTNLESAARALRDLSDRLDGSVPLANWAERLDKIRRKDQSPAWSVKGPSAISRWGEWSAADAVTYVIWREPWMAAGSGTYIGSVLSHLGLRQADLPLGLYPAIDEELLRTSVGLFSSEPFPFARKEAELRAKFSRGAIVDGESFSWFGIRGLRFLESIR